MKYYQIYFHPIVKKWKVVPEDAPLMHKLLMASCAIAALAFLFGISPLGFLTLPLFAYLALQRLWLRLCYVFLASLLAIAISLVGNFVGEYISALFESNSDAWWAGSFFKFTVYLILISTYYQLISYPFIIGIHQLDWGEIVETKQENLEKLGFAFGGTSTGRSRKEALTNYVSSEAAKEGEYRVFEDMMTDELSFLKADGAGLKEGVKGLVTEGKVITFDVNLPVQPQDRFLRELPSGLVEEYIVEDPGFQSGVGGAIEPHFQAVVRRSDIPPVPPQTIINNVHGENARVNINSVDKSQNLSLSDQENDVFYQLRDRLKAAEVDGTDYQKLLEAIDSMESASGTSAFKNKYTEFMGIASNHASVFGALLGALALLL